MTIAPLQYWFPGVLEPPAKYAARFLDDAGRERVCLSRSSEGPEPGIRGCLASPMHSVIATYVPSVQRWDRIEPGAWIGVARNVQPEQFARPRQFRGYAVELGDGNAWMIPIANPFAPECSLPAHDVLRDGVWVRQIADRYIALSARAADLSAQVRAAVLAGKAADGLPMDDDELRNLFAAVLALNYDLTLQEMSALRLFSPDTYWPVVAAFIDWATTEKALEDLARQGDPFGGSVPPDTSATDSPAIAASGRE